MTHTDLTFITNEEQQNLKERFQVLIKDTKFFDCLVGYFYTSGFHAIYKSLESTEKIRILIGISTSAKTFDLIMKGRQPATQSLQFSHAETKQAYEELVEKEMEDSEDSRAVEDGVTTFIQWIRNKKLEIRAYPTREIHAKLYILTFAEGDRDVGRVITGSSNFTQAGLIDNLEFNVELKSRADYEFAKQKFEELWAGSVDVSEKYVQTIEGKTWLNQMITPYQLYLKFLYEYFKDELSRTDEVITRYLPPEFKKLEYQEQAVLNAKKILEEYGGVFISDVVGLGKTYISAMLAGQLDGRTLVIAPPALLDEKNPGSWRNVFSDFRVPADYKSIGKLEAILDAGPEKYKNVIIDEAHRFRTETNITYEKLAEICRGKRVVLVSATPYNNSPRDILSQIKLFQKSRKSTIPNLPDLEGFFTRLEKRLKRLDRQRNYYDYIKTVKENAREIREKVLKYLMVRRTRTEIIKYFERDFKEQNLKFPEIAAPQPLYYQLSEEENRIFDKTVKLISSEFTYARYKPMLYYKGTVDQLTKQSQQNMGSFMKILLIKRLESSFHAFRNSLDRFIHSYEIFIREYEKGNVYISKKHIRKIFDLLEEGDDAAIQKLIDEDKAERYSSGQFRETLIQDLRNDLEILQDIKTLWRMIRRDPKLLKFLDELKANPILRKNKLIIFTESKETAEYLDANINRNFPQTALCFTGSSGQAVRDKVIDNFDARVRHPKDDYRILISTEVLAEGVNLHRANTVINYDIPWNPTRMMQRVGRVNRVDTPFDTIYTFNFFPTEQSNDQIKLKEAAEAKINAFLTLLGGDAALLTEGEPVGSHELFNRLISKKTLTGEDEAEESELKYLHVITELRNKEPELFEKIKRLPKKARTARVTQASQPEGNPDIYLDPNASVEIKKRNLPHWEQKGKAYFVTFRLYDSIPKKISEEIKSEREQWLKSNKISSPSVINKLSLHKRIEYHRLFSKRYDDLLDSGYGSCILQNKECKQIVERALKYFDGERYDLDKFVVMPNHVHVIVIPKKDWTLSEIVHSWKSYTANELNRLTKKRGPVWMPESFDHIIRSPKQLAKIRQYIKDNPSQAKGKGNYRQDACDTLLTYFRRGKIQKFFIASPSSEAREIDFMRAAEILECGTDTGRRKIPRHFYDLLDKNKLAFIETTTEEFIEPKKRSGRDSASRMLKILKATLQNTQRLTEDQEDYLKKVILQLDEGGIPKQTVKEVMGALKALKEDIMNPLKVVGALQTRISPRFLEQHYAERNPMATGKREVILSEYLEEKTFEKERISFT